MLIMGKELPLLPDSPQGKFWSTVVAIGVGAVTLLLFADNRWMSRAEATKLESEHAQQMVAAAGATDAKFATTNQNIQFAADQNAKRGIDNELFKLEQVPPAQLKPQDRALYQKLVRDRAELVDYWIKQGRPLR